MKKFKLLLVPLVIATAGFGVWLSNVNDVNAENNPVCSAEDFRDEYLTKISVEYNGDTTTLTNNSGLNLDYKFLKDADTTNEVTGSLENGGNVSFTVSDGGLIYFYLQDEMSDPCLANAGEEIGKIEFNNEGLIDNPLYYDSICVNYRNKWGNNTTMQNAVPYCYSTQTYSSYSREEVQGWIDTAESLYNSINSGSNTDITIDDSYKEVSDVKNTEKLVCDAFSNNNYETMHKYYHIGTDDDGAGCKVTCKEEIEVNFSDPVATQAGMCFQYLIEIKSKVTCDSSYTAAPPTRKQVCYPAPVCVSGSSSYDAGGPNEEFDSCVKSCDGGKYTQKCIDSCYYKVYKNSGSTKIANDGTFTKDEIKALSPLYVSTDTFYEARKMANNCSWSNAQELYELRQKYPGGYYSNGSWIQSGTCPSALGPYYFRSLAQTQQTINMMNGTFSYSGGANGYDPDGNGILRENYGGYYCSDSCYWSGSCGSDTVLTETLAQEQYEKEVQEYMSKKQACEQKAATCTNETTSYEIVVDNVDNDNNTDDDEEKFSSSQKLNSTNVTGDFPDMVILTDGSCEDGKDDPWHYHNIITFPGTWLNNKTGMPVHSMDPGREDFYTYVGNQYCTKLNSVPVNTAWYDWKVNQNGNPNALTDSQKQAIEDVTEMNINGHIDNYGYFGWNFDVSCFYALDNPTSCDPKEEECIPNPNDEIVNPGCPPTDPNWPDCDPDGDSEEEPPINNYDYRPISLDNLFPDRVTQTSSTDASKDIVASNLINEVESLKNNDFVKVADTDSRAIGFNWTCAATNLENPDYLVQPVTLINQIQALGDSIYDDDRYLDYHIVLTPETMNKVRKYNSDYDSYVQPSGIAAEEKGIILNAGSNKTSGITVYKSYLLHKVLNSNELLKSGLIGCNNEDDGTCVNVVDTTTSCYNEYMADSAILKGAE